MIQVLLGLVLASALIAGVQTWRYGQLEAQVAEDKAAATESALLRERGARATQTALDAAARKGTDAFIARATTNRAAADGVDAAYRSLLDAIADAGGTADDPAAGCAVARARVGDLERVLAEVAGAAAEGGRHVARLDAKILGLQEYARVQQVPVTGREK